MSYRYLGNKTRLVDWIVSRTSEIVPTRARIADPMCGTGAVSEAFAAAGYSVLAGDALLFPTLHAKARLNFSGEQKFDVTGLTSYQAAIDTLNNLKPQKGLFWSEYSSEGSPKNGSKPRKYFTGENAAKIDAIRQQILEWRTKGLVADAADLLLHDLILAVNRVANIAGTYGFYRSSWNTQSLKPIELKTSSPTGHSAGQHQVVHGSVDQLIAEINACDLCYLDPPYTKRQYGGNYHILETVAQEDQPEPIGEGGLRSWQESASDFCYKRKAPLAFKKLVESLTLPVIMISYSTDGQVAPDDLFALLSRYGSVTRHETPFVRFDSNGRGGNKNPLAEHLYVLERT